MVNDTAQKIATLSPVEWNSELVLTTAQLAEFYGTTANSLRVNFFNAQKRDRFIEGKHFFLVTGAALENLRVESFYLQIPNKARGMYLWTKRGAARHAKMLNTDKAWEVFEMLEDAYFARPPVTENATGEPTDFERGTALMKLASHTKDPNDRRLIVLEASKLIAGREFLFDNPFYEPDKQPPETVTAPIEPDEPFWFPSRRLSHSRGRRCENVTD